MTNAMGDGLKDYIEKQVKNIEGNDVVFVRKQFPEEKENKPKSDAPLEYKDTAEDAQGNKIDPNSMNVSLAQMENLAKEMPEIKRVTPSYGMRCRIHHDSTARRNTRQVSVCFRRASGRRPRRAKRLTAKDR